MIDLNKLFFYFLQALVVGLLIKALTPETENFKIAILSSIIILTLIILNKESFQSKKKIEGYDTLKRPLVSSVFEKPSTYSPQKFIRDVDMTKYPDKDVEDLKNIMMVDKKLISALDDNEKKAREVIRKNYQDDMRFTNTHEFNTVPLGSQIYSYTYLPPENWFRAYERPPVCISDQKCPVCPTISSGSSMVGLMEFDAASNITGPLGIDTKYIEHKLNKRPL
jgi:hypothetical protein